MVEVRISQSMQPNNNNKGLFLFLQLDENAQGHWCRKEGGPAREMSEAASFQSCQMGRWSSTAGDPYGIYDRTSTVAPFSDDAAPVETVVEYR
jgi:hypothetical protein